MKIINCLIVPLLLSGAFGCANTTEGAKKDLQEDSQKASQKFKEGIDSASNVASNASNAVMDTASAASLTLRIKNAINANAELNDSKNLVDVDTTKDEVTLKGHVWKQELKDKAEEIAKEELKKANATQKVKNDLAIQ